MIVSRQKSAVRSSAVFRTQHSLGSQAQRLDDCLQHLPAGSINTKVGYSRARLGFRVLGICKVG